MSLRDRVAIVTGGARGIGAAIAAAFRAEGAHVVVADRALDGLQDDGAVALDVRDPQSHADLVATVLERHGRLDVMVNNAGIVGSGTNVERLALESWQETLDVNLTGTFLGCRAALPTMLAQRYGRIVNVSSQLALCGSPGFSDYTAAKAGVLALTKSLAREVAAHGITVNAICPGPTETEMTRGQDAAVVEEIRRSVPLGRLAVPEEIAPAAVLLASDAGAYFTGSTLNVSGGHVM